MSRIAVVGSTPATATADMALPFQCSSVPPSPPIQASSGRAVNTAFKSTVVPDAMGVNDCPSKCSTVPPVPTIQTSSGPLPHTSSRLALVGTATALTARPSKRNTVPASPTAHMSSGALRSEEHTSELQSQSNLVCRLLL